MANPNPCLYAMKRYVDKRRWLNLWTLLLWIFGATVVIFCCIAILLFIRETWLPGALTVLGTIVNGAGIAWVVKQRKGAEAEERSAFKTFRDECRGGKKSELELLGERVLTEQELNTLAWRALLSGTPADDLVE